MNYIKNTNTNTIEQLLSIPPDYYGKEKETFKNKNGITCQKAKLKDDYILLTENDLEVQEIVLEKIKEKQIALIKKARDEEMGKDHITSEAYILEKTESGYLDFVFDEKGKKIKKQFKFNLKNEKLTIIQPDAILARVLFKVIAEPDYYLIYSCKFIDSTQGYVALDGQVANSISNHLENRGVNAVFLANECEEKINSILISKEKNFEKAKSEIEAISFI